MAHLIRTQVIIPYKQMRQLQWEARKAMQPVSELIQIAIRRFLQRKPRKETNGHWEKDPLIKAFGKIRLSVSDASVRHNQYLYKQ